MRLTLPSTRRWWQYNLWQSEAFQQSVEKSRQQQLAIQNILWTNGLATIDFDIQKDVEISYNWDAILAKFYLTIDGKSYCIGVSMTDKLIQQCPVYPYRKHPLQDNWLGLVKVSSFIRDDIHPYSTFILYENNWSITKTSAEFWDGIRRRIPSNHPLSTT